MVRAVLFDLDRVLVDSYQAWFHLITAAARDVGYPPVSPERFQEIWGQGATHAQNPHVMNQTQHVMSKFGFSC